MLFDVHNKNRDPRQKKRLRLGVIDDSDSARALDRHGLKFGGCADWVRSLEDVFQFFQCTSNSLDAKEVPDDGFDGVPADEDL